jgi:hypothetical protein
VQATHPAVLEKIVPKVTEVMNESLLAPFSYDDFKKTIFNIGDFKAPGPNGLMRFFTKCSGNSLVMIVPKKFYKP